MVGVVDKTWGLLLLLLLPVGAKERVRGEETANLFHYLWGLNSKCGQRLAGDSALQLSSVQGLRFLVLAFGVANILSVVEQVADHGSAPTMILNENKPFVTSLASREHVCIYIFYKENICVWSLNGRDPEHITRFPRADSARIIVRFQS